MEFIYKIGGKMEKIVEKAKQGEKGAFTELMLILRQDLYKISKVRLQNDEDIYDAIQETMLIAFKSIKKLKYNEYFKTWIIRILINECNRIYRKKRYKETIFMDDSEIEESIASEEIETIDQKLDFEFICRNLKYEERIIIILYYMEKYTDKEIGEILNIKENTVRTKRTRAKEKIRKICEGERANGYNRQEIV
jgi:RNA polymerase sigma-70 factor (ECF subfamily)